MELDVEFRECVRVASLLHDYGKIDVPDAILKKDGRLNQKEYEVIKTHSNKTRDILSQVNFEGKYKDVPEIAGSHHEKWDGQGYPEGLVGEEIHLGARIVAVADYYEAVTSKRHYRDPMPTEAAVKLILEKSGKSFDPVVVEAFLCYIEESGDASSQQIELYNISEQKVLHRS
jgi:HD-GYP domain-containing protein (c-di-GMP phosphodiesterase class II)